ncbi:MAG: type II toxin-antitoxin system VapC family toxin [Pyrinomonadaceae bacterium]
MTAYFFDTSGLVKRFSRETGSIWTINLLKPSSGNTIYIARITAVETVSALTRRARAGSLTLVQAGRAIQRFEKSLFGRYAIIEIRPTVANRAMLLAKIHGLRGFDAVQLAAALTANDERLSLGANSLTLVSADTALNAAASLEGLMVDNPNHHP